MKGGAAGAGAGGGARKRAVEISGEEERVAISTYFHGSDFSGPGKDGWDEGGGERVTVSAVFTSRGNYIKSFCKGREN